MAQIFQEDQLEVMIRLPEVMAKFSLLVIIMCPTCKARHGRGVVIKEVGTNHLWFHAVAFIVVATLHTHTHTF